MNSFSDSPKLMATGSFMQDDDGHNPYGFLREGIHSEDNIKSENLENANLEMLGPQDEPMDDDIDSLSVKKDFLDPSTKKSLNFESIAKRQKSLEDHQMYPHESIPFDRDSELNLQAPIHGTNNKSPENMEDPEPQLEKKPDPDEIEEHEKSADLVKDENR